MAARQGPYPASVVADLSTLIGLRRHAFDLTLYRVRHALARQAGNYRSVYRGRGMDFEEVREYSHGDDVRNIDWRVTARTGTPYTKIFREERERPVMLFCDQTPAMFFGTQKQLKSILAARLAALLGWSAVHHGDRAGGIVLGQPGIQRIAPGARKHHLLQLLGHIARASEALAVQRDHESPSRFSDAIWQLQQVTPHGSLVFLISDFSQLDEASQPPLARLARHSSVIALQTRDPLEMSLPSTGNLVFSNGQHRIQLPASPRTRNQWKQQALQQQNRIETTLNNCGIPVLPFMTDCDEIQQMARQLGLQPSYRS